MQHSAEPAEFYVFLSTPTTPLPSKKYIRVIGLCSQYEGQGEVASHYALKVTGARFCRLLEALLDAADLDVSHSIDPIRGPITPVVLPQATRQGCEMLFEYLELLQHRTPSVISRPLRSPVEECIQPWELSYLIHVCFAEQSVNVTSSSDFLRKLLDGNGKHSIDLLLEVAMLSDFLLVDSLRDLVCAFIASLGLSANSETDLMRLLSRSAPLSEDELQAVYDQLPFLAVGEDG